MIKTCLKCTENSFSGIWNFEAEDNIRSSISRRKVKRWEKLFVSDSTQPFRKRKCRPESEV